MNVASRRYLFLTLGLLLLLLGGSMILANPSVLPALADDGQPSMQDVNIRVIILQAKDAWVNGDAAAFANLFTDDGELIVPGQRWQGRAAIQAESDRFLKDFTVSIKIRTILVEGNQAAVEWDWSETPKAKDQKLHQETHQAQDAILIEFEAGRIRRWREYIDAATESGVPDHP